MERFVEAVRAGEVPDAATLRACAEAFEAILDGEEAGRSLGVTRPRGRPRKGIETMRELQGGQRDKVAAVVEVLDEYDRLGRYDQAEARVAPRYSISPRQLQRWRHLYGEVAEGHRQFRALHAEVSAAVETLQAAGHEIPGDATLPEVIEAARRVRSYDK